MGNLAEFAGWSLSMILQHTYPQHLIHLGCITPAVNPRINYQHRKPCWISVLTNCQTNCCPKDVQSSVPALIIPSIHPTHKKYCWWFRNPANQLRSVVYPILYKVLAPSQVVVWNFWTINSIIPYIHPSSSSHIHQFPPSQKKVRSVLL